MMWQAHIVPMLLTVALWWGSTAVIARLIVGDPQRYPFLLRLFATIGAAGFANFMTDPRWANHAAHLETPKTEKDDDGNETEMDPVNLATLRGLVGG